MRSHIGGEREQKELINCINSASFVIAHHTKFELHWLARCGMDLSKLLVYDTMLGEWVVAGNRQWAKDLDSTAKRYGVGCKENSVSRLIKAGVNPSSISPHFLQRYCEQDVRITVDVFLKQRQLLAERKQLHILYSRCLLTPVLADIETNGVTLDKKEVENEYARVKQEYEQCRQSLQLLYASVVGDDEGSCGINWNSRKQVGEFLYDKLGFAELKERDGSHSRTDKGARRTDSAAIEQLKATTVHQKEFVRLFKEGAKLSAKLSKTLEFFKAVCDEHEGTFHGIFNQGVTATHRLSSSGRKITIANGASYGAQLQNMPREYKRLVRAKKDGYTIVEIDGSGLEFRVATDLGHDQVAYDEIVSGADIHSFTAEAFVKAGDPVFIKLDIKERRQQAKPQTFKPMYGGQGSTKYEKAYCEFFKNKYSGISAVQTGWTYDVLRDKQLRTPYGMIFYWPDTTISKSGYITNTTAISNYAVQGLATAEIIPVALVHAWHKLQHLDVRIILTVHDSIVLEVGPDVDREELFSILLDCLTKDVYAFMKDCYNYSIWCPLGAEIKEGEHWGEGKGIKQAVMPN